MRGARAKSPRAEVVSLPSRRGTFIPRALRIKLTSAFQLKLEFYSFLHRQLTDSLTNMPAAKAADKKAAPSHPPYKQMIAETLRGQGKKEKR